MFGQAGRLAASPPGSHRSNAARSFRHRDDTKPSFSVPQAAPWAELASSPTRTRTLDKRINSRLIFREPRRLIGFAGQDLRSEPSKPLGCHNLSAFYGIFDVFQWILYRVQNYFLAERRAGLRRCFNRRTAISRKAILFVSWKRYVSDWTSGHTYGPDFSSQETSAAHIGKSARENANTKRITGNKAHRVRSEAFLGESLLAILHVLWRSKGTPRARTPQVLPGAALSTNCIAKNL